MVYPLVRVSIVTMGGVINAVLLFGIFRLICPLTQADLEQPPSLRVIVRRKGLARFPLDKTNDRTRLMRIELVGDFVLDQDVPYLFAFLGSRSHEFEMRTAF